MTGPQRPWAPGVDRLSHRRVLHLVVHGPGEAGPIDPLKGRLLVELDLFFPDDIVVATASAGFGVGKRATIESSGCAK
jgi:hypothetical protein